MAGVRVINMFSSLPMLSYNSMVNKYCCPRENIVQCAMEAEETMSLGLVRDKAVSLTRH
jgi:hypothetical protein